MRIGMCNWIEPAVLIRCDLAKSHIVDCNTSTDNRVGTRLNHHSPLGLSIFPAPSYGNDGLNGRKFNTNNFAWNIGCY